MTLGRESIASNLRRNLTRLSSLGLSLTSQILGFLKIVKGDGGGAASAEARVTCLHAWRASLHWPLTPPPENLNLSWMHRHLLHVPRLYQAWRLFAYESHRHAGCCECSHHAKRVRPCPGAAMAITFFTLRLT